MDGQVPSDDTKLLEAWMDMHDDPQREDLRNQYAAGAGPFYDMVMHQAAAHAAAQGAMPPDMQAFVAHCINEYTRLLRDQRRDAFRFNANMLGLIMVTQADLTEQRELRGGFKRHGPVLAPQRREVDLRTQDLEAAQVLVACAPPPPHAIRIAPPPQLQRAQVATSSGFTPGSWEATAPEPSSSQTTSASASRLHSKQSKVAAAPNKTTQGETGARARRADENDLPLARANDSQSC